MENNTRTRNALNNIVISLLFIVAYGVLLFLYNDIPLNEISNFKFWLFLVCSGLFSLAGIFFAAKSYKTVKKSSVILIIVNSLGLLIPLVLFLMVMI